MTQHYSARLALLAITMLTLALSGCKKSGGSAKGSGSATSSGKPAQLSELFNLDGRKPSAKDVVRDNEVSSSAKGSLRVEVDGKRMVPLHFLSGLRFDAEAIIYRAKVRVSGEAKARLHMRVVLPAATRGGRTRIFISRSKPVLAADSWQQRDAGFLVHKGESPERLYLDLHVVGKGRAWIDEMRLMRGPLPLNKPSRYKPE